MSCKEIVGSNSVFYEERISSDVRFKSYNSCLRVDMVRLSNGETSDREIYERPEVAAVLAIDDEEVCLLVRQYRYAIKRETLEIPAGKLDYSDAADHRAAALRELREETGTIPSYLRYMGHIHMSPGCMTETIHLYVAKELTQTGRLELDKDELLSVERVKLSDMRAMIADGAITDSKTVAALALAEFQGHLMPGRIDAV
jgi:ADP-ribose pyrophosphatase